MKDISNNTLLEFLKISDRISARRYVLNGLFLTVVVGLTLDFITFGLSMQKNIHYIMDLVIGIMLVINIVFLLGVSKRKYQIFLYKSFLAFYFSIQCILCNIGFYGFMFKSNTVEYTVGNIVLLVLVLVFSYVFTLFSLKTETKKTKTKKYIISSSFITTISIVGYLFGSFLGKNVSQSTNNFIVFISTSIIGYALAYFGIKFFCRYSLAIKYRK